MSRGEHPNARHALALRRQNRRPARAPAGQRQTRTPAQILAEDYGMSPRQIDEASRRDEPARGRPRHEEET